jgi:hypothetical protein
MGSFFEGSAPPTATTAQSSAATYPDWFNQYIQTTANRAASAGSMPYVASPFALSAGLSQDQLGASAILRQASDGAGRRYAIGAGQIDRAAAMPSAVDAANPYLANATKTFTGATVNDYLNPFNDAVTSRLATLAGRNLSENLLPKVNDTFIGSGQFGSSGNTEFTARALRDTQEGLLGQQANTLQDQFNKSAGIFNADAQRALGAANTVGNLVNQDKFSTLAIGDASNRLGSTLFNNNIQQAAGLASIGNTAQQNAQNALDRSNAEFAAQRTYPMQQAQFLANNAALLRPAAGQQTVSTAPLGNQMAPSGASQTLGGLAGVAGIAGSLKDAFPETLSSIGGFLGFADGGMVRRFEDGGLNIGDDITPLGGRSFAPQRERVPMFTPRAVPNPVATLTAAAPMVAMAPEPFPYDPTSIATGDYDPRLVNEPAPRSAIDVAPIAPIAPATPPVHRLTGGLPATAPQRAVVAPEPQGGLSAVAPEAAPATPAVDPAAALRARADQLYSSVRSPEERLQSLQSARDRLAAQSATSLGGEKLLALAAGFLSPTRSGGFGESLGNALSALAPINERERRARMEQEGRLLQLDTQLAEAGLRGDDRILANAARFEGRANDLDRTKAFERDRQDRLSAQKEEWAQRAADRKIQQSISAGHLGIAMKQLERGNWEPAAPGPETEDGQKSTVFINRNDGSTKLVPIDFGSIAGGGRQSAERDKAALYETLLTRAEQGDAKAAQTLDLLKSASANPEAAARGFAHIYEKISQDPQYIGMSEEKKLEAAKRIYQEATSMARQPSRLGGAPTPRGGANDWPVGAPPPTPKRDQLADPLGIR